MSGRLRKIELRARNRDRRERENTSEARIYFTTCPWPRTANGSRFRAIDLQQGSGLNAYAMAFGLHRLQRVGHSDGQDRFIAAHSLAGEFVETDDELRDRIMAKYLALPEDARG